MHGFGHAAYAACARAYDGDEALSFRRLALGKPAAQAFRGGRLLCLPETSLQSLAEAAFHDLQFYPRASLVRDFARLAADESLDARERFALRSLLENALIAAEGSFPLCQDTGSAAVYGWKGQSIFVEGDDEAALAAGTLRAWSAHKLRNSQLLPSGRFDEANSGNNAPLSCELFAHPGADYRFLFVAKGGGSSNKTALFQETKALLKPAAFEDFARKALNGLGVSACPPYRIALILGGQSPEETLLAAKLATTGLLDGLPEGDSSAFGVIRDRDAELLLMKLASESGWGAQFGGRAMARDARVFRLARHAASLPVALAVSCAAHRQAMAYINENGVFLESLAGAEKIEGIMAEYGISASGGTGGQAEGLAPAPEVTRLELRPGAQALSGLKPGQMVALHGPVVLVRDAAHARLAAMIERGEALPAWTAYAAFYASPTETPQGAVLGSIGPTTSRRMDSYAESFLSRGFFKIMLGKGERSAAFSQSCARHGGLYLCAVGGAAALAAARYVRSQRVLDWPELGME
ncbi:MAG TPA: fumarate hydratase, partial [Spirochaetaceae bacterium]|nr:fumarate hydratase [Spirochaetaceae bacterium]